MGTVGKKNKNDLSKVDRTKLYTFDDAFTVLETFAKAKFDETIEVAIRLGVDARKTDQMVRGACSLPNGTGRTVRVAVFAKAGKAEEALKAGADLVGAEDLAEKIQNGELNFDKAIATPDMMGIVGRLGKILGPRGMMPNPKLGTVTPDVAKAVVEQKTGKVEFRIDKAGIIHAPVGKRSFNTDSIKENIMTLLGAIKKAKPAASKGIYIKSMAISATMSPGVKIDVNSL